MQKVKREELQSVVHQALARLPQGKKGASILALVGELGAGKTTFTQALARELGITEVVQSPTYVLMRSYEAAHPRFSRLVHIDAYRLEGASEFDALDPKAFLNDPKTLIAIEWPEKIEHALPAPDVVIKFSAEDAEEGERYIGVV